MKDSKVLLFQYQLVEKDVNETLNAQISRCLGKRIMTDEEIEESTNFLTFVDDMTGENIDFRFLGVDADGNLLGVREDDSLFDTGTLRINNILLSCKIEIIEMLEGI